MREQGTEVKLCPLRLKTIDGELKKEARLSSAANGPAAHAQQSTRQRKQRRAGRAANGAGLHRSQGQPDVKQGGAAGYLEKEARATSTPNPHL